MKSIIVAFCALMFCGTLFAVASKPNCGCVNCKCTAKSHCGCMAAKSEPTSSVAETKSALASPNLSAVDKK